MFPFGKFPGLQEINTGIIKSVRFRAVKSRINTRKKKAFSKILSK